MRTRVDIRQIGRPPDDFKFLASSRTAGHEVLLPWLRGTQLNVTFRQPIQLQNRSNDSFSVADRATPIVRFAGICSQGNNVFRRAEQHPPGYAPSPSWRSSVQARNASSKRRFVNSAGSGSHRTLGDGLEAQVKYTVFLGSAEFVAQMRKLLRGDRDQQTGVRRGAVEPLTRTQIVQAVSNVWNEPWKELLSARGSGVREAALFFGRSQGRLSLKELGKLAGGIHQNAVSIAIRRFTQHLRTGFSRSRRH